MKGKRFAILISVLLLVSLVFAGGALAAPANDDFASATVIDPSTLPFVDLVDNTQATTEPGEPGVFCGPQQTVWYSITPTATSTIRAVLTGVGFSETLLQVWRAAGPGFAGLTPVGTCRGSGFPGAFTAEAGTTYYLQVGTSFFSSGGSLSLTVENVPPPPNDAFSSAASVATLPFSDTVDPFVAASVEAGEPNPSCRFPAPISQSTWYVFTPTQTRSFSATILSGFQSTIALYTGGSLAGLQELGCSRFGIFPPLSFQGSAGSTYHLQVSNQLDDAGPVTFGLDVTPDPVASYFFFPSDASIFDTVQFFDQSFDPGQVGIQSERWQFGDGTTTDGCCPTHRYASDSDYNVRLMVTTFDGRTASTSQIVHVITHDVAITSLGVPNSGKTGQTTAITVGLTNTRYPETVEVGFFKSTPTGFQPFGTLVKSVPAAKKGHTTSFSFNYTFTGDDATIGKVSFKAVATVIGARDALLADNEAIAQPTRVKR